MGAISLSWGRESIAAIIFSFLLVISLVVPALAVSKEVHAEEHNGNIVLGYYTSWNPPADLDPSKLTHINYSFADVCWDGMHGNPDNDEIEEGKPKTWPCEDLSGEVKHDEIPNGSIVLYDSEVDLVELENLAALKEENPDLKTLISVGGWTLSNNLSLVARTEETRQAFADSAVEIVQKFNLDGLDLDWEYPVEAGMPENHRDESDKENHTKLLQAVRDAFDALEAEDGKEYLVTIAGAANWAYAENNELAKIAEIVDYIAIMAYDINGTWSGLTGHNAPLHFDPLEAKVRGWNFGADGTLAIYGAVPKDKLVMGVPFYGHSWAGCNPDNDGKMIGRNGPYQQCEPGAGGLNGGTVGYDAVKPLVEQDGYKYFFDGVSKVPYLYNEEKGEFISYDNVESLKHKVNFIKESGLAGAMIWDLSTDDKDYNLLKTVSHGLGVSTEAPESDPAQPGATDNPVPFEDIEEHWAKEFVSEAYWNGWINGFPNGEFKPDNKLTRIQSASLLVRVLGLDDETSLPFTDVSGIEEATLKELEAAYAGGVVKGYPNDTFKPYHDVSRAQLALMIYRTYAMIHGELYETSQEASFPDIAGYDTETRNAIAMVEELGIAEGDNGLFKPEGSATRAHTAKMLTNFAAFLK